MERSSWRNLRLAVDIPSVDDSQNSPELRTYLDLPDQVADRLQYYRNLAAELGGFDAPEVREYLARHAHCHPMFVQIAEGMRKMHENWKASRQAPASALDKPLS
jgi:hypothetical protein